MYGPKTTHFVCCPNKLPLIAVKMLPHQQGRTDRCDIRRRERVIRDGVGQLAGVRRLGARLEALVIGSTPTQI